jgi:hypothetical protein
MLLCLSVLLANHHQMMSSHNHLTFHLHNSRYSPVCHKDRLSVFKSGETRLVRKKNFVVPEQHSRMGCGEGHSSFVERAVFEEDGIKHEIMTN